MTIKKIGIREKIVTEDNKMLTKWYSVNDIYSKLYGSSVKLPVEHKKYQSEYPKHFAISSLEYFKSDGYAMICDIKGFEIYLRDMKLPIFADTYNNAMAEYNDAKKVENNLLRNLLEKSSYKKNGETYLKMVMLSRIVTGTDVNMKRIVDKIPEIKTITEKFPIRNNHSIYLRKMEFINVADLHNLKKYVSDEKYEIVSTISILFTTANVKPLEEIKKRVTVDNKPSKTAQSQVVNLSIPKLNGTLDELKKYIDSLKKENMELKEQLKSCDCTMQINENEKLKEELTRIKQSIGELITH